MHNRVARKTTVLNQIHNDSYASFLYYLLSNARKKGLINLETFRSTRGVLVKRPRDVERFLINIGYLIFAFPGYQPFCRIEKSEEDMTDEEVCMSCRADYEGNEPFNCKMYAKNKTCRFIVDNKLTF